MSLRVILRILGLLLMLFSLTMLPPTLISLWFRDGVWSAFISGIAISVSTGLLLYLPNRRSQKSCVSATALSSPQCSGRCWHCSARFR
ncbi:hypothetical protein HORIV_09140 [Vreelandella olivaria]|uniref:Uncharacterized protein n=1 Tax=Vreelandella olivaria TaxID=390919 RepID=A0ABN5WUB4_9GAMM|nr:hypothetical protein HORIV_09140 [Halomonas olivaria]